MKVTHASHLTDAELTDALGRLVRTEREATVALIVHLGEFDARRLYEPAGYRSMFKYCRAVLRLSEDAAYNRIESARAARRHPVIVDMLEAGTLSPTTARLLARHLTPENRDEVLAAASGLGKEDVEELLACRFPRPDVQASVRRLPTPKAQTVVEAAAPVEGITPTGSVHTDVTLPATPPVSVAFAPPPPRPVVEPLAPERYGIHFTISGATRAKLRTAQDLLSHAVPSGDLAEVFDRALTALIEDLNRSKWGATRSPRPFRGKDDDSRNIPAEVKRAVWIRDGGRCAFISVDGHRCGSRRFVEFHHVVPYAKGGKATVENIQLRCRAHNGHEVELAFGRQKRHVRDDVVSETAIVYVTGSTRSRTSACTAVNKPTARARR